MVFDSAFTLQLAQELLREHWKTNNPELRKVSGDGLCATDTQNVNLKKSMCPSVLLFHHVLNNIPFTMSVMQPINNSNFIKFDR